MLIAEGADRQEHATKEDTNGADDDANRDSDGTHEHEAAIGVDQAFNPARCAVFRHFPSKTKKTPAAV